LTPFWSIKIKSVKRTVPSTLRTVPSTLDLNGHEIIAVIFKAPGKVYIFPGLCYNLPWLLTHSRYKYALRLAKFRIVGCTVLKQRIGAAFFLARQSTAAYKAETVLLEP